MSDTVQNIGTGNGTTDWQTGAQEYLARLAFKEWTAGRDAHVKAGRKAKTYRHFPSEYHRELVELLGQNDEHGFKGLKGLQGYASAMKF